MQLVSKELLKDDGSREDLQVALADILNGIRDEWNLSVPELAAVLSLPAPTIKGWLRSDSHVGLSSVLDHNTQAVVDFIDIYNMIASFFVKKTDQVDWFKKPSERFGGRSPMDMISENPHNLVIAKQLISSMLNP